MDNETYDKGQKIRLQLDQMSNQLSNMDIGLPLVWLYVWDVIKSTYEEMGLDEGYYEKNPNLSIDDVWNAQWESPIGSLEFGVEALDEEIREWLIKHEFILSIE